MSSSLTSDDARYSELFDVAKESSSRGGETLGDLTPAMNALRERAPVIKGALSELLGLPSHRSHYDTEREHYSLFTFDVCDFAFRHPQVFSSEVYRESPGVQQMGHTILQMVGDEHKRYRGATQHMFLRRSAVGWWKPNWIDESVQSLLDRLEGRERADLNLDLCARLPVHVVTRGMGMRGEDALTFREHLLRATTLARSPSQEVMHSRREVARMLKEVIDEKRREPGDDVISGLVQCDLPLPDGGSRKLTEEEIVSYARLIMNAGGGTTWRQLGITIVALLRDYRFWESCRDDRELLEPAIQEAARWLPTDPMFSRLVKEDTELEGVAIPAGCRVDLCLGAANRDPSRWDHPDIFEPQRPPQTNLAFGMGSHRCLGIHVALQEMMTALGGLLDRFPHTRLDPDAPAPRVLGSLHQRGMSAIPVLLAG